MSNLFSSQAGQLALLPICQILKDKKIYHRKHQFIVFVCGGKLGFEGSLRYKFLEWARSNLQGFTWLLAEDALKNKFSGETRKFVNLARFETIIADVADCVLIFPESPGSFAEVGFFANSKVRDKTLIVNPLTLQAVDSFLSLGPIDRIGTVSFLKPMLFISHDPTPDFGPIADRLKERIKWSDQRERLPYQKFKECNFKQKLIFVFIVLQFLRLADQKTLRHVIKECLQTLPPAQEITHLLGILIAAKFVEISGEYFKPAPNLDLVEIEHLEIDKVLAQIEYFYSRHAKEMYEHLREVTT